MVYYAGHGIEVDQRNYLVPVDAELGSDHDVEYETVPLDLVVRAAERASGLRLVILDACRDNPFAASMRRAGTTRSIGRGLARVEPAGSTLVAYAAKGGTVAADGDGRNSPYTEALLAHLEEPGLEVGMMFRRVRDAVLASTRRRQEPFVYGSLSSEMVYLKAPPVTRPAQQTATTVAAPTSDEVLAAHKRGDYATAFRGFRILAEQGNAWAQNWLGFMYGNGQGVDEDDSESVRWYRKAAKQGNAMGQYNLGLMYAKGEGVARDDAEAVRWFRKGAERAMPTLSAFSGSCMYAVWALPRATPRARAGIARPPNRVTPVLSTCSVSVMPVVRGLPQTTPRRCAGIGWPRSKAMPRPRKLSSVEAYGEITRSHRRVGRAST